MDQTEVHVELAVAQEVAVAAGHSTANAAGDWKRVVVGEGVAVEAGNPGLVAVDLKATADSENVAGSKSSHTYEEECSSSEAHLLFVAVHSLLLSWRSPSTVARR